MAFAVIPAAVALPAGFECPATGCDPFGISLRAPAALSNGPRCLEVNER